MGRMVSKLLMPSHRSYQHQVTNSRFVSPMNFSPRGLFRQLKTMSSCEDSKSKFAMSNLSEPFEFCDLTDSSPKNPTIPYKFCIACTSLKIVNAIAP